MSAHSITGCVGNRRHDAMFADGGTRCRDIRSLVRAGTPRHPLA